MVCYDGIKWGYCIGNEMKDLINKIHHADCMDIMKDMNDKCIDLVITDPPYNIKRFERGSLRFDKNNNYKNGLEWDNKPNKDYFNELFRVSQYQIIWGANNFELPTSEYFIVWDKQQTVDNFASAELAYTNIKKPAKIYKYSIHKHNQTIKIHPTQKPISLYRWLLQNYAKQGQLILDTHSGSGSCAIACHLEGFDFIAIEKDKDYYNDSVKRLKTEISQLRMFA